MALGPGQGNEAELSLPRSLTPIRRGDGALRLRPGRPFLFRGRLGPVLSEEADRLLQPVAVRADIRKDDRGAVEVEDNLAGPFPLPRHSSALK